MTYTFTTPYLRIDWQEGSHTANVTTIRGDMDVFTFAWEKNFPDVVDFTEALASWINYSLTVEEMNV